MSDAASEHVDPKKLFALIWANRHDAPPEEGEGADPELARMFRDLGERYQHELAPEHRLGPETARRLWAHARSCHSCRIALLEDGPDARPPKTKAEVAADTQRAIDERAAKVWKFWFNLPVGLIAFGGAFWCINEIRSKQFVDVEGPILRDPNLPRELDPLWLGFFGLVLVASWFLAEAYTLARDLWIDFTAWKRAVPVVGKAWVAWGKKGPVERGDDDDADDDDDDTAPEPESASDSGDRGEDKG